MGEVVLQVVAHPSSRRHAIAKESSPRSLTELDPESCEERRAKCLRRRHYRNPGPNNAWHMDGYDKLKPYGFPVHGCIDGWLQPSNYVVESGQKE